MIKFIFDSKKAVIIFVVCCILGGIAGIGIAKVGNDQTRRMIEKYAPRCECVCMVEEEQ